MEQDFDAMKIKTEQLNDMPVQDKFKDMNFDNVKEDYHTIRDATNRLKRIPADADLKTYTDINFDGIK